MFKAAQHLANAIYQKTTCGYPCYGKYALRIYGEPLIPKPFSSDGKAVIDQALRYIGITGNADRQVEEQILSDEKGTVTIRKLSRLSGSSITVEMSRDG